VLAPNCEPQALASGSASAASIGRCRSAIHPTLARTAHTGTGIVGDPKVPSLESIVKLAWQDLAVLAVYLGSMILLGSYLSRRQRTDDEYFLAGRRMPWFAVGISVIASLLSSLTYLSEPGEVWKSGITHMFGKMLAIPIEMAIVWFFCIPFMMRFRFTSAYEYLEHRFGKETRLLGVALFVCMVVLWMGFVVLASARALAEVSGIDLIFVIVTLGVVATVYTMLGGLRAVIWTDVIQVALLIGGGVFTMLYVAQTTGSWIPDWFQTATEFLESDPEREILPWFSIDPTVRATVFTVALHMCVWHVCTHMANQMTVQRYFSTRDVRAARRSFVTGSLLGVGINLMLVAVGLAMMHLYLSQNIAFEEGIDPQRRQDLIFPTFAVTRLPAGVGGAILAALLAAAMSSIDSGINSIATVLSVELRARGAASEANVGEVAGNSHVRVAMVITLVAGSFVTAAAYGLTFLPDRWGIVGAMPRTFNAVTAPLGGLFLVGVFLPFVGQRAVITATVCGLATSITIGYFEQIGDLLQGLGILGAGLPALSFTWVMPSALLVTFAVAAALGRLDPPRKGPIAGLTWTTRNAIRD
jgi:SSS family solute:Na+ symporter